MHPYLCLLNQLLFVMMMNVTPPLKTAVRKPDQQERVAFLLSQVGSRSAQEFARLIEPLGLVPADAGILRLIARFPGISQQGLAQALHMHASRLVLLIDDLESRGLVVRKAHPSDRRLYSLALTTKGEETLQAIMDLAEEHNRLMCAALTRAEATTLHSLLSKIVLQQGLTAGVHPGYGTLDKKLNATPRRLAGKAAPKSRVVS
jgi:DNA-binding MarR family transcriptional regulator